MTPRLKRTILRILPFGLIWLATSVTFFIVEAAVMIPIISDIQPIIKMTPQVALFATSVSLFLGFTVGFVEVVFVERWFRHRSFVMKILAKFLGYLFIIAVVLPVGFSIAVSLETGGSPFSEAITARRNVYLGSIAYWSTMFQIGVSLLLTTVYTAVSEYIGFGIILNLLTGKYHKPKVERRIFLFVDMKDSTTYAESLGHIRYFDLLRAYYESMSNAIIDHHGEVYQYIGDEVVISWDFQDGFKNNRCIRCFFAMRAALANRAEQFKAEFGVVPGFKAGIHVGEVTTGEIGALKKEIFFTGDVLNVTSRLQGLCNTYQVDLIVSGVLKEQLHTESTWGIQSLGEVDLKGRQRALDIYAIQQT